MGRWLCEGRPTSVDLVDQAICRRFLPKSRYSDANDYRFSAGDSLVVERYLQSRQTFTSEVITVLGAVQSLNTLSAFALPLALCYLF